MLEQWLPIPTKHDFKKNYMQVLIKPNLWQNPGEWAEDLRNTYFWPCTSIHLWKRTEKCWIHIFFLFLWANFESQPTKICILEALHVHVYMTNYKHLSQLPGDYLSRFMTLSHNMLGFIFGLFTWLKFYPTLKKRPCLIYLIQ